MIQCHTYWTSPHLLNIPTHTEHPHTTEQHLIRSIVYLQYPVQRVSLCSLQIIALKLMSQFRYVTKSPLVKPMWMSSFRYITYTRTSNLKSYQRMVLYIFFYCQMTLRSIGQITTFNNSSILCFSSFTHISFSRITASWTQPFLS